MRAARKCSLIIATSKYIAERLIAAGLPSTIVKPIYIGGAISSWGSPTHQHDPSKIRVLSVGTMQYHKGFQNMIIAAKKIRTDDISPEVIIVGDGPYRHKLRNLVIKLGVTDQVKLPGRVSPEELTTLFDWCDTVVVPTITPEPFGRVAVEAMSRGRSVIGTQAGGITEIIDDGETGFLVPPGDSSAIADKLVTFRNHPHLLTEMGERALAKCKGIFDQAMIANQVLQVYRGMAPNT